MKVFQYLACKYNSKKFCAFRFFGSPIIINFKREKDTSSVAGLCRKTLIVSGGIGEHGVVVTAFSLYWGGTRFESLLTHHYWSLSKSFIPSLVVWSMTKNNAFGGEKRKQKEQR